MSRNACIRRLDRMAPRSSSSLSAAVASLVPLLNQLMPAPRALHVPAYVVALVGKYLCFAMLALAVDLVWGFAAFCRWATPPFSRWAATPWACT